MIRFRFTTALLCTSVLGSCTASDQSEPSGDGLFHTRQASPQRHPFTGPHTWAVDRSRPDTSRSPDSSNRGP